MRLIAAFVLACLAPVPPYRAPKPVSIVGAWRMQWGHATYSPTGFAPDGHYESGLWRGAWTRQGDRVEVIEWLPESESPPIKWSATLEPGKRCGKMDSGAPFALTKLEE